MDIERVKNFAKERMKSLKETINVMSPAITDSNFISMYKGKVEAYEEILGLILNLEDLEKELENISDK